MLHYDQRDGSRRFMTGLHNAYMKGYAAAADQAVRTQGNPYKRYEHRRMWDEGLTDADAGLTAMPFGARPSTTGKE